MPICRIAYFSAVILLLSIPFTASAKGVGENMKSFWEGAGGISNSSGASAYQAQAAGYYTMGSLYARTPVKNTQIAGITMPSINAGCGGIDIYNGAFSFINSAELQKVLKAIANNSTGFAMQLALETISPVIAEKIEELQTWIQRINAMNINSCETAASLVGGLWPKHDRASQTICSTLANGSGIADDYALAKHNCHANKSNTLKKIKEKNSDSYDKLMVEDVNLAWKALKDSGFLSMKSKVASENQEGDTALAQLFMTLSGTIIIGGGDKPKYEFISGRAAHNDIIQVLMEGGTIKSHHCDETEKCLNVTKEGTEHTISLEDAFKTKVEKMVISLVSKVKTDDALTEEEKKFINNQAWLHIYKAINVHAAYSGAEALFELSAYIEPIALRMMFEYLNDVLRQVELASNNLIIASDDHLQQFKSNLNNVRKALVEREHKAHQSYATLNKLVERTMVIEGILANQLGSPVAESFQWSKNL